MSKALKNLEEEYGLRIFERSSTGMIPTEQGKRFIRQAQQMCIRDSSEPSEATGWSGNRR